MNKTVASKYHVIETSVFNRRPMGKYGPVSDEYVKSFRFDVWETGRTLVATFYSASDADEFIRGQEKAPVAYTGAHNGMFFSDAAYGEKGAPCNAPPVRERSAIRRKKAPMIAPVIVADADAEIDFIAAVMDKPGKREVVQLGNGDTIVMTTRRLG